jgi:hypothetical protein
MSAESFGEDEKGNSGHPPREFDREAFNGLAIENRRRSLEKEQLDFRAARRNEAVSPEERKDMIVARLMESFGERERRGWRSSLLPGGFRLMAHERALARKLRPERITVPGERSLTPSSEAMSSASEGEKREVGILRRLVIVLELLRYRLSRLLILRIAGLRRAQQRSFEQAF